MEPIAEAVELDEGDLLFEGHGSTPRGAQQQHASASHSDSDAELEDATAYHGRRDQEEAEFGELPFGFRVASCNRIRRGR